MRRWTRLAVVFTAIFLSCTTTRLPSPESPAHGCHITCPNGYALRRQHICRGGRRWFEDVLITGRHTTRGADGGITLDVWITDQGDFPVIDVEMGTCASYVQQLMLMNGGKLDSERH